MFKTNIKKEIFIFFILIFISNQAYSVEKKPIKNYLKSHNIKNPKTKFYVYSRCGGVYFAMHDFFKNRGGASIEKQKKALNLLHIAFGFAHDAWFKKNKMAIIPYDKNNPISKKMMKENTDLIKKYKGIYFKEENFTYKNKKYYAKGFLLEDIKSCNNLTR